MTNLLLAGAWHSWVGGWSWGPRLLAPTIPLWLIPAGFWLDDRRRRGRDTIAAALTVVSIVVQIPGILVKDQEMHHIRRHMLTDDERPQASSDYPAVCRLLWHKLTSADRGEVYRVSEVGVAGDRELDLRSFRTFLGLNLWTEHLARRLHRPIIRWFPLVGVVVCGLCATTICRRLAADIRARVHDLEPEPAPG